MSLSDTARDILLKAAQQPHLIATPPARLPIAAQRMVVQSMLKTGLLEEVVAPNDEQLAWRTTDTGLHYFLRVTVAGMRAVDVTPTELTQDRLRLGVTDPRGRASEPAPSSMAAAPEPIMVAVAAPRLPSLRAAAQMLLDACDDPDPNRPAIPRAFEMLRGALPQPSSWSRFSVPRQPRADTKRAAILALLRRPEGASVTQVVDATGWARHTVHGFFAGLKQQGMAIEVLNRVRQVGAGQGAKGSYTVYRIGEAG